MGKGKLLLPARRNYTLIDQAMKVYHKTHNDEDWRKFVVEACGSDTFMVTDICKQVDARIFREDLYDL